MMRLQRQQDHDESADQREKSSSSCSNPNKKKKKKKKSKHDKNDPSGPQLADAKAQYRGGTNSSSLMARPPPPPPQQQQQSPITSHPHSHPPTPSALQPQYQFMLPPQVGAFRVMGPGRRHDDEDDSDDDNVFMATTTTTANVEPVPDATVTPIGGMAQEEPHEDEEEQQLPRSRRKQRGQPKKFPYIVGALISLIVILIVVIVVVVVLVMGGNSNDSDSNSNNEANTELSCHDKGGCDPGTVECQEDAKCKIIKVHAEAWEASGCLGVLDCGVDDIKNVIRTNTTLDEACNSIPHGTQECHDNIICRRRKKHVNAIMDGKSFQDSSNAAGACEETALGANTTSSSVP